MHEGFPPAYSAWIPLPYRLVIIELSLAFSDKPLYFRPSRIIQHAAYHPSLSHPSLSPFAGFAFAAFNVCAPTVPQAMSKVIRPAPAKIHHSNSIR